MKKFNLTLGLVWTCSSILSLVCSNYILLCIDIIPVIIYGILTSLDYKEYKWAKQSQAKESLDMSYCDKSVEIEYEKELDFFK